jgi:polyphosphate kinase 2 (PPK2 family)
MRKLQTELCQLQEWVKQKGLRAMIVFEGRDAAGCHGALDDTPDVEKAIRPKALVPCLGVASDLQACCPFFRPLSP